MITTKVLLTTLSSCIVLSTTPVNQSNNKNNISIEAISEITLKDDYEPYDSTKRNYFIRAFVDGILQTFVLSLLGVDVLADKVREYVWNKWKTTNYTYTYVEDDGCWSPEFPANPFCRIKIEN